MKFIDHKKLSITGMNRWYVLTSIKMMGCFIGSLWIGLFIFKLITGIPYVPYPWQIFTLFEAIKNDPSILHKLILSLLISFVLSAVFVISALIKKHHPDNKVLGDAHFASCPEIKKAGFFNDEGVIVGKSWGQALKAGGFEHVIAFAPAGSGKTTSLAIPNLLTWHESCVVNDPKFELFETTSGYRKKALENEVFLWAPTRLKTHRYNPLQFISLDPLKRIGEIQLMAHVVIPDGKDSPIWYQTSRDLFLALVLYLLDSKQKATFAAIYALLKQDNFYEWVKAIVKDTTHHDPEMYRNFSSYLNAPDKTRGSTVATLTGNFEIYANPIINAATSESDFDLRELRKKKMTIYIGFSENERQVISPLLTIFWQQLISFMTENTPDIKKEPHAVLCLMEEFSILGRLVNLKSSLKILRGYRVRVLIIIQYLAQIDEHYSRAESEAFKNIKTKIIFALDSFEDAQYVSKILGVKTKRVKQQSTTSGSNSNSSSHSHHLQSVPLLRSEEIQRLKPHKAIIIRTGFSPVMATQYRWYEQHCLKHLPCEPIKIPQQTPVIIPFEKSKTTDNESKTENNLEIEKMKIQATLISSAVVNAINSNGVISDENIT